MKQRFFYEGKFYRPRNIETISALFLQARTVRALLQTRIDQWQDKVVKSNLRAFWGFNPPNKRERRTFTVEKDNHFYPSHSRTYVQIERYDPNDLKKVLALEPNPAKFMADECFDSKDARALLEQRLKGDIKLIPQNQKLADEYSRLEIRRDHARSIIYLCEQFLLRFISKKFRDLYGPFTMETVIHLTIKDHTYTIIYNRAKFIIVDDIINHSCTGKEIIK